VSRPPATGPTYQSHAFVDELERADADNFSDARLGIPGEHAERVPGESSGSGFGRSGRPAQGIDQQIA
jgi:hypothetical protein